MRRLLLIVILLTTWVGSAYAGPAVVADENRGVVVRDENIQYLVTDKSVGWNQFLRLREDAQWQKAESDTLNGSWPDKAVWVRFSLERPAESTSDWTLEVRWPELQKVAVRQFFTNQGWGEVLQRGAAIESAEQNLADKNFIFPLTLPAEDTVTVYLRLEDPYFIYMPLMVWSEDQYEDHALWRLAWFCVAFGILLIMTLYNGSLYIFTRDRMYLFYSNGVFSSILYLLAVSGYGRLLLWGGNDWLLENAGAFFAAYCYISVTYFFRVFLELRYYGGWVYHFNTAFMVLWSLVLMAIVLGMHDLALAVTFPAGILVTFVGLATAISLWLRGNQPAKFFIIAWLGISISTTLVILSLMGRIDYFPALEYGQIISFVIEVTLLSLALADRIRREREEKEQAQALALEQQASILELKERDNVDLEERVQVRTRELESVLTELRGANSELSKLTKIDPLTRVYNRRHFDEVGEQELTRARRAEQPVSVIMLDLDYFKTVNDQYGHLAGDKCLKLVAQCIQQHVSRPADLIVRYGGEEFAVVLPDTDAEGAARVADRIRIAVEDQVLIYEGNTIRLTASFGVAGRVPREEDTLSNLVADADAALYVAKKEGRNCVHIGEKLSCAGGPV